MITAEEREEIINAAVEKALLMLPGTVGNLIANHAALLKMNKDFYAKYPEFSQHRDVVQAVIEKIDGEDTLASYEEKLARAIPLIREHIATKGKLNLKDISKRPDRRYVGNGAI